MDFINVFKSTCFTRQRLGMDLRRAQNFVIFRPILIFYTVLESVSQMEPVDTFNDLEMSDSITTRLKL